MGIALMVGFIVWEWKFAKLPIVPKELFRGQRIVGITFLLVFVAGMNFYSLINCKATPTETYDSRCIDGEIVFPLTFADVYTPDPIQVGLKGLGYGISVTAGAAVVNWLLSVLKNYNRELMIASCVVMSTYQTISAYAQFVI